MSRFLLPPLDRACGGRGCALHCISGDQHRRVRLSRGSSSENRGGDGARCSTEIHRHRRGAVLLLFVRRSGDLRRPARRAAGLESAAAQAKGRLGMAKLNINGKIRDVEVEADTPLLWAIREQAGLTGTKYGCGVAQCGACSVHLNGKLVRSCSIPVGSVKPGDRIVTIEGLSRNASHAVQKAWAELDVPQCGYCQSGQIMAAASLLAQNRKP